MSAKFDLIIVGGGITGVATALDAAGRGLSVLLLEQYFLGSGTSSKTSKLAHGGLRYLQQYQFSVVRESLSERNLLLKKYPDLVQPLSFCVPVYKHDSWNKWVLRCGLWVYDFLSFPSSLPYHQSLSKSQILSEFPQLESKGLQSGFRYYDAQMDDLALLRRLAEEARALGVVILEQRHCHDLIRRSGKVCGVKVLGPSGQETYFGNQVMQAAGPWSNFLLDMEAQEKRTRLLPSKGVHIVLPGMASTGALLLQVPQDKRVFFVIPWKGKTLVGTTETVVKGVPEQIGVDPDDVNYLLRAFLHYFPQSKFGHDSILETFVGLRPLLSFSRSDSQHVGEVSRDFAILESKRGFLTVIGGKYTTHRRIAESVVDRVVCRLGGHFNSCQTRKIG